MKTLFFRLYLLLLAAIIGLGWSIEQLVDNDNSVNTFTSDLEIHKGTLFLLNKELIRQLESEQQVYLEAIAPSFGFDINLFQTNQLTAYLTEQRIALDTAQLDYLALGGVVSAYDDEQGLSWFMQKQLNTEQVIVLGPIVSGTPQQNSNTYTFIFFSGLALVVFLWVWPISRGLMALTQAANEFGKGDFSVRAKADIGSPLTSLTQHFNDMAQRIQRLIKSHKDLSHAVSHELRTPIARIRFAMEMVRDSNEPQMRNKYLDTMDDNIEELDGLVDELLIYARFDREEPELHFQYIDIQQLLNNIIAKFREPNPTLSFSVRTESTSHNQTDFYCDCDKDAITRVVDNLVRNAVRYANTQIDIALSIEDGSVKVAINDDGCGIPKESWDTLFEPFVRLDQSRDRNSGGIGLGLAIVKRYIELHDGCICIDKAACGGASFIITWPQKLTSY